MKEEELRRQLNDLFQPLHQKQLDLTEAIIEANSKAFELGIEVGKQLPKE